VNLETKFLNPVIFFRSSELFCESSDFLREGSLWKHCAKQPRLHNSKPLITMQEFQSGLLPEFIF